MLKTRLLSLAIALIVACLATTAEARRGGGVSGTQEFMEFVARIKSTDGGPDGSLALCHLIERHTAVFLPLYYVSKGYVLSDENCTTDSYYPMILGTVAEMKAAGAIPADLPEIPELSCDQRMTPYFVGGFGFVIMAFVFYQKSANRASRSEPSPRLNTLSGDRRAEVFDDYSAPTMLDHYALLMVEVMCHIARRDWMLDEAEVKQIVNIAQRYLDRSFDDARIRRMIDNAPQDLTPRRFQEMARELTPAQKENVMRAALLIAGAEQQVEPSAQSLIRAVAGVLSVSQLQHDRMITELARPATA
jgi:tellurite resistance protein